MSGRFSIPVAGLKEGRYTYDFELDNSFFEEFEEPEIREGNLIAIVTIDKKNTHFDIGVSIKGVIINSCDRCLGDLKMSVSSSDRFIVKPGTEWDDDDPDLITMPAESNEIDLRQHFYDFIMLSLPIKKVHTGKPGTPNGCDPVMIEKLNEISLDPEGENDSRWDDLKKLLGN